MELTEVKIHSYSVVTGTDIPDFRFEATALEPGELPHTSIFVYTIVDVDDAASDVFARVALTTDMDNLLLERDAAIAAEVTEYLSSFLYRQYPAVETAIVAKDALRSRINELCNGWVQYRDTFIVDDNDVGLYPSGDPSLEEARLSTYTDAKNTRIAAEAVLAEKDTAVSEAEISLDNSRAIFDIRKTEDDFAAQLNTEYSTYKNLIITEGTTAESYRVANLDQTISTAVVTAASQKASAANTVSANETALADANIERSIAAAELSVAQAAENAALAALLDVCPSFDPSTV